jgi:flagellar protein FlbD
MIELTLIDDTPIVLNSDLIEFMEARPDTIIALTTGKKMMVKETVCEVVERIIQFRRRLGIVMKELVEISEAPVAKEVQPLHGS